MGLLQSLTGTGSPIYFDHLAFRTFAVGPFPQMPNLCHEIRLWSNTTSSHLCWCLDTLMFKNTDTVGEKPVNPEQ